MDKPQHHESKVVVPAKIKSKDLLLSPEKVDALVGKKDLSLSPWHIFKVISEFVTGYEFVRHYKRAVTFFGSARCGFDHKVYQEATKLAYSLSKEGFAIVTGGGPGIMEAANKGAMEAGGESVGLNIQLPFEQRVNPYVNESTSFHFFFTRKVMLASASQLYVFFPGGYGTMDELFEMMTLVQTKKISPIKIVLVGKDFWQPLTEWIEKTVYEKNHAIAEKDIRLYYLVDDADEALSLINGWIERSELIQPREEEHMMENNREGTVMPGSCPAPEAPVSGIRKFLAGS